MSDIGTIGSNSQTDLAQPVKGDGYSLTHDPMTGRWRADVWTDSKHRVVPLTFSGPFLVRHALLAGDKLVSDFAGDGAGRMCAVALRKAMLEYANA